jgi:hypothetical protein
MKAYWRSRGRAPHILDLGTRWRRVVSFTLRFIYHQGKSPWYPLDRRLRMGKDFKGGYWPKTRNSPGIHKKAVKGTIKNSIRKVGNPGDIRTINIPNVIRYRYNYSFCNVAKYVVRKYGEILTSPPVMSSELNVYLTFITFYVCLLQKTKAR